MTGIDDHGRNSSDENDSKHEDYYGILGNTLEVDSDVNEDRNRERQLDESFRDWYRQLHNTTEHKER